MLRDAITLRAWAWLLAAFFLIAACRAGDLISEYTSRPTVAAAQARPAKTHTPTATSTETEVPTDTESPTVTEVPTDTEAPTETEVPTDTEPPAPRISIPTEIIEPTETPVPTREFEYLVSYSWCGPNRGETFVEGIVYKDGDTVDGLLVRLAVNPGGDPIVNDYKTGTDSTKPGGYTQIIGANGPRGGLWYVWLVDPQTKQRISDIATVKTDSAYVEDTDQSSGSCQSATVNFSNNLETAPNPTEVPSAAPTATRTPTITGTPPTKTPTQTGTPSHSVTPTQTSTPTQTRTPTRTRTPTNTRPP